MTASNREREPGEAAARTSASPGSETLRATILADASTHCGKDPAGGEVTGWVDVVLLSFRSNAFFWVMLYRLRMALHRRHVPIVPAVINRASIAWFGANIDEHSVIAPGFRMPRGNVVFGGFCMIGRRATIGAFVTLGTRAGSFAGPTLGDDVVVGDHSSILGPWRIGDGATIGPGSVVTSDIEPGTTVAGVPAKPVAATSVPGLRVVK